MREHKTQPVDRGVRIAGSIILLVLSIAGDMLNPAARVLSACLGLYGLGTGLCNYCPLADLILREKSTRRETARQAAHHIVSDCAACAFFAGWTRPEIVRLAACAELKRYEAGRPIIEAGSPVACWHIIIAGEVEQVFLNGAPQDAAAAELTAGDSFGDEAFISAHPAAYTATARTGVRTLELNAEALRTLLADTPALGTRLLYSTLAAGSRRMRVRTAMRAEAGL